MKKLNTSLVLVMVMLFAVSTNPSFASTALPSEVASYLEYKQQQNQKSAKRFTGKMDEDDESRDSDGVDIIIDELISIEGEECAPGSVYRFSTTSEFQSVALDVLLTVQDAMDLNPLIFATGVDPVTGAPTFNESPCVGAENGRVEFWLGQTGARGRAFADINYQVVRAGTNIPVKANIMTMTAFDLDIDTSEDENRTDDVFLQNPTNLLVSPGSRVISDTGNFFDGQFTHRLAGTRQVNCGNSGGVPDASCRGAASWDSNNIGISDVTFKIINEETGIEQRLFVVSFRLEDAIALDNIPPTGIISGGPTTGVLPLDVSFSAEDSFDADGEIVEYFFAIKRPDDVIISFSQVPEIDFRIEPGFRSTGTFMVELRVTDDAGSESITTRDIIITTEAVEDITPPTLRILGQRVVFLPVGSRYEDAGAVALDDVDGAVEVSASGTVDTATPGEYRIEYSAVDSFGNVGTATRTIIVDEELPAEPPQVTLTGPVFIALEVGQEYVELGATASDPNEGDLDVVITGEVDITEPGSYRVFYTATNGAGIVASAFRRVNVTAPEPGTEDSIAPVLTLNGAASITVDAGSTFTDPGASAIDNIDGIVTVNAASTVDLNTPGQYAIVYTATDAAGNTASITRTVIVVPVVIVDTNAPVITIIGDNPVDIDLDSSYIDLGATAQDNIDGDVLVTSAGEVNTTIVGSYTITYSAVDNAGNEGTATRTINVNAIDTPPVMSAGCPRGIFDDGNIYNADAVLVENSCSIPNEVCPSQFFYGSNTFIDAICIDGTWQREQGDEPAVVLEACPRGVFENGTMYSAALELVENTCSNEAQVCADQYFYGSQSFQTAVCSEGSWQPQEEACPRGIFANGKMYNAELEFVDNTCMNVGQICDDQYFYANQAYSQAVCTDDGWQEVANTLSLSPRSGNTLSAAPVNPLSSAADVSGSGGGSLGWISALLLGLGGVARRRRTK